MVITKKKPKKKLSASTRTSENGAPSKTVQPADD